MGLSRVLFRDRAAGLVCETHGRLLTLRRFFKTHRLNMRRYSSQNMNMRVSLALVLCGTLVSSVLALSWYQVGQDIPLTGVRGLSFSRYEDERPRIAVSEESSVPTIARVSVFELSPTSGWTQMGSSIDVTRFLSEHQVALSGDLLVIGDVGVNNYKGQVRTYTWMESSNTWQLLGSPINGQTTSGYGERLGYVVRASKRLQSATSSASYHKIAILSHMRVRVFTWDPSSEDWIQNGNDLPSPPFSFLAGTFRAMDIDDWLNYAVISDGYRIHRYADVLCIGCSSGWQLLNSVTLSTQSDGSSYEALAMSGNGGRVVVGNPSADSAGANAGTVQVYDFTSTSRSQVGSDIYGANANDWLGTTLAMSSDGTRIVVRKFSPDAASYVQILEYHATSGWTQLGSEITVPQYIVGSVFDLDSQGSHVAVSVGDGSASYVKVFKWGSAPPPPPPPSSWPPTATSGTQNHRIQALCLSALAVCVTLLV